MDGEQVFVSRESTVDDRRCGACATIGKRRAVVVRQQAGLQWLERSRRRRGQSLAVHDAVHLCFGAVAVLRVADSGKDATVSCRQLGSDAIALALDAAQCIAARLCVTHLRQLLDPRIKFHVILREKEKPMAPCHRPLPNGLRSGESQDFTMDLAKHLSSACASCS